MVSNVHPPLQSYASFCDYNAKRVSHILSHKSKNLASTCEMEKSTRHGFFLDKNGKELYCFMWAGNPSKVQVFFGAQD